MEDIVKNGIYDYTIFVSSGKYHETIWTSNNVIMANHICDLEL
jgi:hypothetical protein